MAAHIGRENTFVWGGTTICTTELGLTINGEPVDVSDGCSDGWTELLEEDAIQNVEISVSAFDKDDFITEAAINGPKIRAGVYTRASGAQIAGNFRLGSPTTGAPFNGAATIEITFSSTGEAVYTPA